MRKPRDRRNGLVWRHQKVEMEWAVAAECADMLEQSRVSTEVNGRTRGLCYVPGCQAPIAAYPHAIPVWENGVHDAVNRAGLCAEHRDDARRDGPGSTRNQAYRLQLQAWLIDWYSERGIPRELWFAMATGQVELERRGEGAAPA